MAVANIGVPYDDFCGLTPDEFSHIYQAYGDERNREYKDNWERVRALASIFAQPYATKQLTPRKLMPFPWDDEKPEPQKETPAMSKEEALKKFESMLDRMEKI